MSSTIKVTHDQPVHGLLTQIGQIHEQVKSYKENDDEVVGFDGKKSKEPNMRLHIPVQQESYINYNYCNQEKEIIILLFIATILFMLYVYFSNKIK